MQIDRNLALPPDPQDAAHAFSLDHEIRLHLSVQTEVVSLLAEDLQVDSDEVGRILVRQSKTDQAGQGAWVAITRDAMHHLRAWMIAAGIERGAVAQVARRRKQFISSGICPG